MSPLTVLGRWDEAAKIGATLLAGDADLDSLIAAMWMSMIASARGDEDTLERCRGLAATARTSTYVDQRASAVLVLSRDALERDETAETLRLAESVLDSSAGSEAIEEAYAQGIEAAIALQDTDATAMLERFVSDLPRARATPLLRAGRARLRAEVAHRDGDIEAATRHEDEAIELLRSVGARSLLARTLLERFRRSGDPSALAEARAIYTELGASRWLARIDESSEVAV